MKAIKENNILLAEFLDMLTTDSEGNIKEDINSFKFHNDWNWLMLVVDKIGKIENFLYPNGLYKYLVQFKIEVGIKCVSIEDVYGYGLINIKHYEGSLIENIYNACVEFIKWYNGNKI